MIKEELLKELLKITLLGITTGVVAGFIVTFMINYREKRRWQTTVKYLKEDLQILTVSILTTVRADLMKVPYEPSSLNLSYEIIYQEIIDLFKDKIVRNFGLEYKHKLKKTNSKGWRYFISFLQYTRSSIENNLSISLDRLDPDVTEKLLNLRKEINFVVVNYSTFPDVIGVPLDQQSPVTKGSKEEISNSINNVFFDQIKNLTVCAVETLEVLIKSKDLTSNKFG